MQEEYEVFEKEVTVNQNHLDELKHVNNVQYVQWIQDVAKEHWIQNASLSQREAYIWVVIRHEIDYKNQAFIGEKLLLQTHIGKGTHVTSPRTVYIKNKVTGKLIVEAISTWCLLNAETKKPEKITPELVAIFKKK